jgi:hypothetical protein
MPDIFKTLVKMIADAINRRIQEENPNAMLTNVEIFADHFVCKMGRVGFFAWVETADGREYGAEASTNTPRPRERYLEAEASRQEAQQLIESLVLGPRPEGV